MPRPSRLAALTLLALAAGCATPPPPPPAPAPIAYVPPPPEPPPPIIVLPKQRALARNLAEEAAAFRQAMASAAAISANFGDEAQVSAALRAGAAFEPKQMQRGAVAFVAIAALGHPEFADAFREYSIDDAARTDLARRLIERPDYAASFPGSASAAGLAIASLDSIGAKAWVQGRAVQQSAYDVQRQPWSKILPVNPQVRLEEARTLSLRRLIPASTEVDLLHRTALAEPPISLISTPVPGPYTGVVNRGLALAALVALGEAGEDRAAAIDGLLDEPQTLDCLKSSKLMLYQCLASADRGPYEDIFCLGLHGMADPGRCMVNAAGSPTPAFVPPVPPPPPEPKVKAKAKAPARKSR